MKESPSSGRMKQKKKEKHVRENEHITLEFHF